MTETRQLPRREWKEYFDRFTKRHLRDESKETVRIDVVSRALGDQVEAERAILHGVSYDGRSEVLEVLLENMDHLVYQPKEIWVEEEDDGFIPVIQIVRDDGTREILTVRRTFLPVLRE
jgi:alpha-D-ribose 1-methylphosphonate 5-triphosphate synthase subunit PhnL